MVDRAPSVDDRRLVGGLEFGALSSDTGLLYFLDLFNFAAAAGCRITSSASCLAISASFLAASSCICISANLASASFLAFLAASKALLASFNWLCNSLTFSSSSVLVSTSSVLTSSLTFPNLPWIASTTSSTVIASFFGSKFTPAWVNIRFISTVWKGEITSDKIAGIPFSKKGFVGAGLIFLKIAGTPSSKKPDSCVIVSGNFWYDSVKKFKMSVNTVRLSIISGLLPGNSFSNWPNTKFNWVS